MEEAGRQQRAAEARYDAALAASARAHAEAERLARLAAVERKRAAYPRLPGALVYTLAIV